VDELQRRAAFTDLSFGVGAAAAIGATLFFVLRPEAPVEADVGWLPGGGYGALRVQAF
jgi:hypothetical protein